MATFQSFQHHHEPSLFPDAPYPYDQYDTRRSKTPTDSLFNHTGFSPGPLITTPAHSRNPSQPPEPIHDQQLEQMLYDDGSFSNSPTSVMTPDPDSMEVEILDEAHNFFPHNGHIMSTQGPYNTIPAIDSSITLPTQDMINYNTLHNPQRYQQHYNMHGQHQLQHLQQQTHHQNYTTQPLQHDPWNGQGPSRSSLIPRSGHVVFDPVTDPIDYSEFVDLWRSDSTDPSSLISPSEPAMPPYDNYYATTTLHVAHPPHGQSLRPQVSSQRTAPMHMPQASPPPDNQGFINYNMVSPSFATEYSTSRNYSAQTLSLTTPNMQFPGTMFEPSIGPLAASPISSDGMVSPNEHSDRGMIMDPYPARQIHQANHMPTAIIKHNHLHTPKIPEIAFDASPEPESAHTAAAKAFAKSGGRALGTHLEPQVAKAAHDMRKIVACWHCVLQRDKCGPGDICERCLKRAQRPNADCGLGCSRIKLVDLSVYFLPALVTQMHEDSNLTHFVTQYIHHWGNVEFTVHMTCGQHTMPRIPVKVYEFAPRGPALLVQTQYCTDPISHKRIATKKESPALGMVHINHNEEKKFDKYINEIVDGHLDAFGELCWKEDDNDFQQKLFKLMTRVKPKSDDEAKLLREIFRLVVVTYIMSHTLTMAEESKFGVLSRMHSYGGSGSYVDNFTSPRMTNRQLKYFFSRLQRSIQTTVLNKLQQIFKSSKGCDKWLAAFVAVLGMCMAQEDQQKTIHLVMETKASTEGLDERDAQGQADIACREIDSRMHFIQQIFRWKYNRKCNPMRDAEHDWDQEVGFGDASSVNFVRQVAQLVRDNMNYLNQRQTVSISEANQTKYTARLVGQFLLSFWLPNA